jgi:hypothetical protein
MKKHGIDIDEHLYTEGEDAVRWRDIWRTLSPSARETLLCLVKLGPTYDGAVPSKVGRDELLEKKLAAKIVIANCEDGFQAATYLGARVWKAGQLLKGAS